eukprot:RCo023925
MAMLSPARPLPMDAPVESTASPLTHVESPEPSAPQRSSWRPGRGLQQLHVQPARRPTLSSVDEGFSDSSSSPEKPAVGAVAGLPRAPRRGRVGTQGLFARTTLVTVAPYRAPEEEKEDNGEAQSSDSDASGAGPVIAQASSSSTKPPPIKIGPGRPVANMAVPTRFRSVASLPPEMV